jgi:hypothetical protein
MPQSIADLRQMTVKAHRRGRVLKRNKDFRIMGCLEIADSAVRRLVVRAKALADPPMLYLSSLANYSGCGGSSGVQGPCGADGRVDAAYSPRFGNRCPRASASAIIVASRSWRSHLPMETFPCEVRLNL